MPKTLKKANAKRRKQLKAKKVKKSVNTLGLPWNRVSLTFARVVGQASQAGLAPLLRADLKRLASAATPEDVSEYGARGLCVVRGLRSSHTKRGGKGRPLRAISQAVELSIAHGTLVLRAVVDKRERRTWMDSPPGSGLNNVFREALLPLAQLFEPGFARVPADNIECHVEVLSATPESVEQAVHIDFKADMAVVFLLPLRDSSATSFFKYTHTAEAFSRHREATRGLRGKALEAQWRCTPTVPAGGLAAFSPVREQMLAPQRGRVLIT